MQTSTTDRLVQGYINPLAFHAVEEPWVTLDRARTADEGEVLRYLVEPDLDASKEAIVERFLQISIEGSNRIVMAPTGVLQSLIWPLRYAKGSYALGNFIGAMALCGMVCEMAAIFMFEANDAHQGITRNGRLVTESFKKYFAGNGFQRAGQAERIKVLAAMGIVKNGIREKLHHVRSVRNRHLHLRPDQKGHLAKDKVKCYLATIEIVIHALGLGIKDGKITLRPEVYAWLDEHGHG
jgi:hypothetical protein